MLGWKDFDATNIHVRTYVHSSFHNGVSLVTVILFQIIGSEKSYGEHSTQSAERREVTMWLGVKHEKKEALELFTREIAPAGTGMGEHLLMMNIYRSNMSLLYTYNSVT